MRNRGKITGLSRWLPTRSRAESAPEQHGSQDAQVSWAEAALEQYGLQDAWADLLKKHQRKLVFRVESPARRRFLLRVRGRFLLRVYRGGNENIYTGNEKLLRSELLWLQALRREAGLTVPEPIPATDGSLVSYASLEGEKPRRCVLLRWVPGRHKATNLKPADLSLVGSQVARLHRHSERYAVPEGFARPHVWNWASMLGEAAPLWSKGESIYSPSELDVFHATAERIRRDLRALGNDSDVFGLIHRDLHSDNFVFRGRKAYVIDFEYCGWGYYLFDVAVALSSLETSYGERCAPLQAAFLEGYWRERPLPKGHRRYLKTFMAMRLVQRLNMVLLWEDPTWRQWGPRVLSGSVDWLKEFVASDEEARQISFSSPWWCKPYR